MPTIRMFYALLIAVSFVSLAYGMKAHLLYRRIGQRTPTAVWGSGIGTVGGMFLLLSMSVDHKGTLAMATLTVSFVCIGISCIIAVQVLRQLRR